MYIVTKEEVIVLMNETLVQAILKDDQISINYCKSVLHLIDSGFYDTFLYRLFNNNEN